MKLCPHCNKKIPSHANYCPHPDCSKPVRQPLLSWLFGRRDALIVGVVVGLLLGLLGANLLGGAGASGEPQVVKETVVVEREVEVTRVVEPTVLPPALGDTLVREKDNMTMVFVPAGSFQMGSEDGDDDEAPIHEVALDAFWIDQTEVSNAQFAAFLNQMGNQEEGSTTWLEADSEDVLIEQQNGSFQPKDDFAKHPAIMLSWYGAEAYCAWAGGRLPSEAEWEYAARGREALIYPWSNQFDVSLASCWNTDCSDGYDTTAPVGIFPAGASWVGAYDMAGNVSEWVNDWFDADYYARSPRESPLGTLLEEVTDSASAKKVLRGGSWFDVARELRTTYRSVEAPAYRNNRVGFRCILSPGS